MIYYRLKSRMTAHPELPSDNSASPFSISENSLLLQEPLLQAPQEKAFQPTERLLLGLPNPDTLQEPSHIAIPELAAKPSRDSGLQLPRAEPSHLPILTQTRASRLAAESIAPSNHPIHKFMRRTLIGDSVQMGGLAQWAIEFIPGPIWGLGDVLSLYMAITRQNPLTGVHIDRYEARLCAVAACIPFVPAKALTGPGRMIRRLVEEGHHAIRTRDFTHLKNAITKKNALKIALSLL